MKISWKKKFLLFVPAAAMLFTGVLPVCSGEEEQPVKLSFLGPESNNFFAYMGLSTQISLDLRNIDIIEALKFLSMKAGLNIVPTQKVSGRVTLRVENVPVKDVFDIMLRSNNLAYDQTGQIYNVMTEPEYKARYGKSFSDTRVVKVFHLKYAIPEQAFSLLDALKSDIGRLLVEPDSGTVMIMDTPQKIEEAKKALEALEHKSTIKTFSLKYARAKDVEEQLKLQLDAKRVGTIKADERNNQVIVQTLPERMKDIEKLVLSLDRKTKQVMVDTKIIKIRLSNELDQGIEWEGIFDFLQKEGQLAYMGSYPFSAVQATSAAWRSRSKVLSDMGGAVGSYPFSGTTSNYSASTKVVPGQRMHVGMVANHKDFDVIVKYLQTLGKTKIISNPTLSVINNEEAKVHIGERRAYVTTTTTTGTTTTTVSEAVTYIDIGVQLSITPTINEDGYVIMKIKPEISSVVDNITTSSNNEIPIIDTSTAETTIMAKDGTTIMLGGLGQEERTESTEGVPFLHKLPFLGFLFRSQTKSVIRTELLILLTPYIFEGDKLITPKDRDKELFGFKEAKKFDVFRKDSSTEKSASSMQKEDLLIIPKGMKNYQGEIRGNDSIDDANKPVFLEKDDSSKVDTQEKQKEVPPAESASPQPLMGKKEVIATKGFKQRITETGMEAQGAI
jgi:type II secretory pathway component GspD/PulD (secretin)